MSACNFQFGFISLTDGSWINLSRQEIRGCVHSETNVTHVATQEWLVGLFPKTDTPKDKSSENEIESQVRFQYHNMAR